jgi:hypothetical protein
MPLRPGHAAIRRGMGRHVMNDPKQRHDKVKRDGAFADGRLPQRTYASRSFAWGAYAGASLTALAETSVCE